MHNIIKKSLYLFVLILGITNCDASISNNSLSLSQRFQRIVAKVDPKIDSAALLNVKEYFKNLTVNYAHQYGLTSSFSNFAGNTLSGVLLKKELIIALAQAQKLCSDDGNNLKSNLDSGTINEVLLFKYKTANNNIIPITFYSAYNQVLKVWDIDMQKPESKVGKNASFYNVLLNTMEEVEIELGIIQAPQDQAKVIYVSKQGEKKIVLAEIISVKEFKNYENAYALINNDNSLKLGQIIKIKKMDKQSMPVITLYE